MFLMSCNDYFPPQGTKKQAPAPPKQYSPFASHTSSTPPPGSPHHPPITPRRHPGKDGPIHAPSHPPPQPPQAHQAQGESEPSPPSTPTPPDTPPHDGPHAHPLSFYHSGSLPRPSRPAPKPRPRPSMPPPPQPAVNDNDDGICGSASKIITGKQTFPCGSQILFFDICIVCILIFYLRKGVGRHAMLDKKTMVRNHIFKTIKVH